MAKLSIILLIFSSFFIISSFLPLAHSKTRVTNVRVYLQDTFNFTQPLKYGDVFAHQDPLTEGPDPNSKSVGRIHSLVGFASPDVLLDVHLSMDFIFESGSRYNGSTVVTVGRNNVNESVRHIPIVGGTGHFKMARGIITDRTYSTDPLIYIYDLEIIQDHYEDSEIEMIQYV